MEKINEYELKANEFLKQTDTSIEIIFLKYGKHFSTDTEKRDIYKVTIKRGDRMKNKKEYYNLIRSALLVWYGEKCNFPTDEAKHYAEEVADQLCKED